MQKNIFGSHDRNGKDRAIKLMHRYQGKNQAKKLDLPKQVPVTCAPA